MIHSVIPFVSADRQSEAADWQTHSGDAGKMSFSTFGSGSLVWIGSYSWMDDKAYVELCYQRRLAWDTLTAVCHPSGRPWKRSCREREESRRSSANSSWNARRNWKPSPELFSRYGSPNHPQRDSKVPLRLFCPKQYRWACKRKLEAWLKAHFCAIKFLALLFHGSRVMNHPTGPQCVIRIQDVIFQRAVSRWARAEPQSCVTQLYWSTDSHRAQRPYIIPLPQGHQIISKRALTGFLMRDSRCIVRFGYQV